MNSIYGDIAMRTNGNIYIGVVGPVRTGKSTFVTNFMQKLVLPHIDNENDVRRCIDELPQSADGKLIMTTQPKFVPDKGVEIVLEDKKIARVRMVDCVGYVVDGAEGFTEGDKQRLVSTPWSIEPIPFELAAEIGTQKVAKEHSTIAVVVTTDGSIGQIPRQSYIPAEERSIKEVKSAGKPFVIVVNCKNPTAESTTGLCRTLQEKYCATVIPMDVVNADESQFQAVLTAILNEFPIRRIAITLPRWMRALSRENKLIMEIVEKLKGCSEDLKKVKDSPKLCEEIRCDYIDGVEVESVDCGKGMVSYKFNIKENLFYKILSEEAHADISDEFSLMSYISASAYAKRRFDIFKDALAEADSNGYGVVYPLMEEMALDEPQMVKQGGIYGVKLTAKAPSYHIIKVDVNADVSPMVGTQEQSQYLLDAYKTDPQKIWNSNMFGRTMSGIASDGLLGKCATMPIEVKAKLTKTVNRIVNENKGGLVCILL